MPWLHDFSFLTLTNLGWLSFFLRWWDISSIGMPSANDSQLFAFNFFGGKTGAVTKSGTLGWTGETPNLVNVVILIHRSLQKLLRFLCKVSSNRFSGMTLIYKWWHESFIGVKLLSTFVSRYKPHLLKLFLFHIYSTHDFTSARNLATDSLAWLLFLNNDTNRLSMWSSFEPFVTSYQVKLLQRDDIYFRLVKYFSTFWTLSLEFFRNCLNVVTLIHRSLQQLWRFFCKVSLATHSVAWLHFRNDDTNRC
jgi:hypothetical protein